MLKFLKITNSLLFYVQLLFYCIDWFVYSLSNSITSRAICRDSVSFGQRVMSYPVNFVTGAIGNIFNMGESKLKQSQTIRS